MEVEPGRLIIKTPDMREALKLNYGFEAGDYELKKIKKRRSLDANAYAWVLMDKLSAALGVGKIEVYRNTIRDIGGVSDTICVRDEAVDALCRGWEHNGTGWQTERYQSKIKGCVNVTLYYGSSVYDTRQMSSLIDHLVQDCKAVDIETMTPLELSGLLGAWDAKKD